MGTKDQENGYKRELQALAGFAAVVFLGSIVFGSLRGTSHWTTAAGVSCIAGLAVFFWLFNRD